MQHDSLDHIDDDKQHQESGQIKLELFVRLARVDPLLLVVDAVTLNPDPLTVDKVFCRLGDLSTLLDVQRDPIQVTGGAHKIPGGVEGAVKRGGGNYFV